MEEKRKKKQKSHEEGEGEFVMDMYGKVKAMPNVIVSFCRGGGLHGLFLKLCMICMYTHYIAYITYLHTVSVCIAWGHACFGFSFFFCRTLFSDTYVDYFYVFVRVCTSIIV